MYAYHNNPEVKEKYLSRIIAHQKADQLVQGYGYWEDGKGCAVGCTLHGSNHKDYETELGIPESLARLEDKIFEGLPVVKAKKWPSLFLKSVKVGSDLSLVQWKFLLWLQKENLKHAKKNKMSVDVIDCISKVILVLEAPSQGKNIDKSAARSAESAAWSARSAAESARSAESAAESAESAAWSARSAARSEQDAYVKMADKLIDLIKSAA